jgi:O-methyltransferase
VNALGVPESLVDAATAIHMCNRAAICPPGAFVEVGVYKGGTAFFLSELAESQGRPLYLYDTFEGMPYSDAIDRHKVGELGDTSLGAVQARIKHGTLVKGIFPQSAVEMGPIAFVHLDCDQYRAYKESLEYFSTRMVSGGVIWCDDATVLEGANKAFREFVATTKSNCESCADRVFLRFK